MTIKVNVALLTQIFDIFIEEMKTEETEKVYLALYTFNVQPLSGIAMPSFDKNGGNPLGILAEDGPLAGEFFLGSSFSYTVRVDSKLPT